MASLINGKNWAIGNIDCTLALEAPKISLYIESMRNELSAILKIDQQIISIKATTTEGLGYTGRGEGAAAWAVALVYQESSNLE